MAVALAVTAGLMFPAPGSAQRHCGDLDCDGVTTASDALRVLVLAVSTGTPVLCADRCESGGSSPIPNSLPRMRLCGDYNEDGAVTASDALVSLRFSVELEPSLACRSGRCGDGVVDGCTEFSPAHILNDTAATDAGHDTRVSMATDGRGLWVAVWSSDDAANLGLGDDRDILYSVSSDGARTWSSPLALNRNAARDVGDDTEPEVATDGLGNWIVVWTSRDWLDRTIGTDPDVLYSISEFDGTRWTPPRPLNSNATGLAAGDNRPAIVTDKQGTWLVAWHSVHPLDDTLGTDADILFSVSDDNGRSWTEAQPLNTHADSDASDDRFVALSWGDGSGWVAAWRSDDASNAMQESEGDILVSMATELGSALWTPAAPIQFDAMSDTAIDSHPAIKADGDGNVIVVWQSRDPATGELGVDNDILFARSADGGRSWNPVYPIHQNAFTDSGHDSSPNITTDHQGVWLAVWHTNESFASTIRNDDDIVAAFSADQGLTWTEPFAVADIADVDEAADRFAAVAVDPLGGWLIAWQSLGGSVDGLELGPDDDILFVSLGCELCDSAADEACGAACEPHFCGDSILNDTETCDDGNGTRHDDCTPTCETVAPPSTGIAFEEVGFLAGLEDSEETWGSAWGDFNGDGWPDLWLTNHRSRPALYQNNRDGTFSNIVWQVWDVERVRADVHSAAWADVDNDGDQDLVEIVGGGNGALALGNHFFQNTDGVLVQDAVSRGLSYPLGRGRGPLWFDWNFDGLLDLFMSNLVRSDRMAPSVLFEQSIDGNFTEKVTEAGIASDLASHYAQLCDVLNDGTPELVVHRREYPRDIYQLGTQPMVEVSQRVGLGLTEEVWDGAIADFDGDLHNDIFLVRNTLGADLVLTDPSELLAAIRPVVTIAEQGFRFTNDGVVDFDIRDEFFWPSELLFIGRDGHNPQTRPFSLDPTASENQGIAPHRAGSDIGIYIGYDNTAGRWTVLVSAPLHGAGPGTGGPVNFALTSESDFSAPEPIGFSGEIAALPDRYLQNNGAPNDPTFSDIGDQALPMDATPCRNVVSGDFDNDMDVDLYLVCQTNVANLPNILYENQGDGSFAVVPNAGGATGSTLGVGDSASVADFNLDGFLDIYVGNRDGSLPFNPDGPNELFRNRGNANHWIEIDLVGTVSNRDGIGARVVAITDGTAQLRERGCNETHDTSQSFGRIHFGLGPHTVVDELIVTWPSGIVQRIENVQVDRILTIEEN